MIILLSFVVNWFNSANASFLCICPDGHISIENIYSSECHQAEFTNQNNHDIQLSSSHDCDDTTLSTDTINSGYSYSKNIDIQNSNPHDSYIRFLLLSIDLSYPLTNNLQADNRPKISTDSIRLTI